MDLIKEKYSSVLDDELKRKSPFDKDKKSNVIYFPITVTSTKRCRLKRQPKGTVKVWVLLIDYAIEDMEVIDGYEVIDLTFSKEEADDWAKQDDSHKSKLFYVKELKHELVSKRKRKSNRSKRISRKSI
jgi:hypothetical protein